MSIKDNAYRAIKGAWATLTGREKIFAAVVLVCIAVAVFS